MALLPGRAVGDVAHRIDRLVRRSGCDDGLAPGERPCLAEQFLDRRDDLQRFGHAAFPCLAALGHFAGGRSDEADAVAGERRAVAERGGVRPHPRVHRRREQHRPVGRQEHRRGEVVGVTVRHLCHQVGRCRRHDHEIAMPRQPDVTDILLVLAREKLRENVGGRDRADGQRRHETLRRRRHHRAHVGAALAQAADQIEVL